MPTYVLEAFFCNSTCKATCFTSMCSFQRNQSPKSCPNTLLCQSFRIAFCRLWLNLQSLLWPTEKYHLQTWLLGCCGFNKTAEQTFPYSWALSTISDILWTISTIVWMLWKPNWWYGIRMYSSFTSFKPFWCNFLKIFARLRCHNSSRRLIERSR